MITLKGKNNYPTNGFDVVLINRTKGEVVRMACDPIKKKISDAKWDIKKDDILQVDYKKYINSKLCKTKTTPTNT